MESEDEKNDRANEEANETRGEKASGSKGDPCKGDARVVDSSCDEYTAAQLQADLEFIMDTADLEQDLGQSIDEGGACPRCRKEAPLKVLDSNRRQP